MNKTKILDVKTFGDPVLRQVSEEVEVMTPELQELAIGMIETMKAESGIGLAAPQIGVNKRMIAIGVHIYDDAPLPPNASPGEHMLRSLQPLVMINPVIKAFSEELSVLDEGCLSIPGLDAEVLRPAEIEIEGTIVVERGDNIVNKRVRFVCANLLSTCFQHEIDHLDGILYVDRASDEDKRRLEKALKKMEKQTLKKLKK